MNRWLPYYKSPRPEAERDFKSFRKTYHENLWTGVSLLNCRALIKLTILKGKQSFVFRTLLRLHIVQCVILNFKHTAVTGPGSCQLSISVLSSL